MDLRRPDTAQELRSLVTAEGALELSLADVPVSAPQGNEVLIRVEAAPINPSDLGLLFAGADMSQAMVSWFGGPAGGHGSASGRGYAGARRAGRRVAGGRKRRGRDGHRGR